jgi:hypothetical protein
MSTSTKKCVSCKTDILLENAVLLHWCDSEENAENDLKISSYRLYNGRITIIKTRKRRNEK